MSIATEITRIRSAVADAYTSVGEKGGTLPSSRTVANLASAIDTIQTGGQAVPSSLSVSGSFTNRQVVGNAPDLTGLSFTVNYASRGVTPDGVSPSTYGSVGSQTVTFSYTENGTTVTATKTATVVRIPTSLSVSGSWTNTQHVGLEMDTTGLTFTVTYNNGSTQTVTPVKSPSTWSSSGTQNATFSYTENGTTVTATKSVTVYAITLSSLTVSGSWTNTQYVSTAPDVTGLTFTAVYSDGSTVTLSPSDVSISPSTWSATAGTQTATFSYTGGGVTVSATKTATVEEEAVVEGLPVGGKIFYIDSSASGTYTFYNANGVQVSAPTVGTDCTGWTYTVTGGDKPKYYVFHDALYTNKRWTYYSDKYVYKLLGTGTAIGTGKTNTATVMAANSGAYITSNSNGNPTIWYQIQQMRTSKVGGCDDWFIGSMDEMDALRTSGLVTWFSSSGGSSIWSSTEYDAYAVKRWANASWLLDWVNNYKDNLYSCCAIRSLPYEMGGGND